MKVLGAQLAYLLSQQKSRGNLKTLVKFVFFLLIVILLFAGVFHWIMIKVENQDHSLITGVYWTLTVMSTLGFGDITFHSDIGRIFSLIVLVSGIVLLLIVLPFTFIRFFYAPWLEAQLRTRAPREVPPDTRDHVIICGYDPVARGLIRKLKLLGVPYHVIEPDPSVAASLYDEGISVVTGEIDNSKTYEALLSSKARLVLANLDDATNTNITLTVREKATEVPVVTIVENRDSIDILQLAGATHVLPLKQRLGEHLSHRVNAGHAKVHVIGTFRGMLIAESPVHKTPLAGRTIRETRLRHTIGVNVVGIWNRGRLLPAHADTVLSDFSVPVVVGTPEQIANLESFMVIYDTNYSPVLVIGCGNVGYAAASALKQNGISVHIIERDGSLLARASGIADRVFIGDAADREVLMQAGLVEAPSVIITTNDDATNIYLAVYCRRLEPDLRIVSRVTHERNIEAIHRAGADFVLSFASLGAESVLSILQNRELAVMGEGIEMFHVRVPESIAGKTLGESEIGLRTGLNVIAVQKGGETITNPQGALVLAAESELIMIGDTAQREEFNLQYG
ncbi:MAG: potassium transporter TrkA [Deltaproteobacteria bacterium HGW-Deltaproteobacteria-15]|jgi:Trk K+ transport system NAD-binding subunit|nr:MAG: potassium transporter TrkA [Deltaproteobacteria bacterium HGW-Deltaproteobacteria-15]